MSGKVEFVLPQFSTTYLPNGQTVHGFGEDANGEPYVLATNTASSGTGGESSTVAPAIRRDRALIISG